MTFGSGPYTYTADAGWPKKRPEGWTWGGTPGMACDARGRVFVYSRCPHPLVVFDAEGNFLDSWGEDLLKDAHGIYVDADDNVYCVERGRHCVFKFDRDGRLVLTIGTPDTPAAQDGAPFNLPTDLAVASTGELFVSDGYGNARVHKYAPDGTLLLSWGERGDGPGQFNLSHCVRVDQYDRVWVCDRENNRIQIFDTDGRYLTEWRDLLRPNQVCFDPKEDIVYISELTQRISIYTLDHTLVARWGGGGETPGQEPGQFAGGPHGICCDAQGNLYVGEVFVDGRWHRYVRMR
jgi:sugar lactone lactonase YvrE